MVLVYFYAKRSNYRDFKHLRDTSELLKGSRFPDGGNPPSVLDSLRKNAFKVTRHFHREQIARMDPVLRHHLRVGSAKEGSKPPA